MTVEQSRQEAEEDSFKVSHTLFCSDLLLNCSWSRVKKRRRRRKKTCLISKWKKQSVKRPRSAKNVAAGYFERRREEAARKSFPFLFAQRFLMDPFHGETFLPVSPDGIHRIANDTSWPPSLSSTSGQTKVCVSFFLSLSLSLSLSLLVSHEPQIVSPGFTYKQKVTL